jgi:hypothetical protein
LQFLISYLIDNHQPASSGCGDKYGLRVKGAGVANPYKHLVRQTKPGIWLTAASFFSDAVGYFEWCLSHPLREAENYMFRGEIIRTHKDKVRAFTKQGLATYLGITLGKLDRMRTRGDSWNDACDMLDQIMYTQKFENAAAGLMNATIIARDLGLSEKQEVTGSGGGPQTFTFQPVMSGTFIPADEVKTIESVDEA